MSKKGNLEKKETMKEIKDNEIENVSGGYYTYNNQDGKTMYGVTAQPLRSDLKPAFGVYSTKEEAIDYENTLKNSGLYKVDNYYIEGKNVDHIHRY